MEKQDLINRDQPCFKRLLEAEREVELLRLENAKLQSTIGELKRELDDLEFQASVQNSLKAAEKVYVPGGDQMAEVCKQGMYKTELCNNWRRTSACQYGDHCNFAHGKEELRTVTRDPHYKTKVCKNVLDGVICTYGERCQFSHVLNEQDKFAARQER